MPTYNDLPPFVVAGYILPHLSDKDLSAFAQSNRSNWQLAYLELLRRNSKDSNQWLKVVFRTLLSASDNQHPLWKSLKTRELLEIKISEDEKPLLVESINAFRDSFLYRYNKLKAEPDPNLELLALMNACWLQLPLPSILPEKEQQAQRQAAQFISVVSLLNINSIPGTLFALTRREEATQETLANEVAEYILSKDKDIEPYTSKYLSLLSLFASRLNPDKKNQLQEYFWKSLYFKMEQPYIPSFVYTPESVQILFSIAIKKTYSPDEPERMVVEKTMHDVLRKLPIEQMNRLFEEFFWVRLTDKSNIIREVSWGAFAGMVGRLAKEQIEQVSQLFLSRLADVAILAGATYYLKPFMSYLTRAQIMLVAQSIEDKITKGNVEDLLYAFDGFSAIASCLPREDIHQILAKLLIRLTEGPTERLQQVIHLYSCVIFKDMADHLAMDENRERVGHWLLEQLTYTYVDDTESVEFAVVSIRTYACRVASQALAALANYLPDQLIEQAGEQIFARLLKEDNRHYEADREAFAALVNCLPDQQSKRFLEKILERLATRKKNNTDLSILETMVSHLKEEQLKKFVNELFVDWFVEKLANRAGWVRCNACQALVIITKVAREERINQLLPTILDKLTDNSEGVQEAIFNVLFNMGSHLEEHLRELIFNRFLLLLNTPNVLILANVYDVLGTMASHLKREQVKQVVPLILNQLTHNFADDPVEIIILRILADMADRIEREQIQHLIPKFLVILTGLSENITNKMYVKVYNILKDFWFHHPQMQVFILETLSSVLDDIKNIPFASCQAQISRFLESQIEEAEKTPSAPDFLPYAQIS